MEKTYKQCQSCAMPMKMDKQGGGKEKDGSLSKIYCSSCYQNGTFTRPNITAKDMQKIVDTVLKEDRKRWRIFRWLAIQSIPRLERRKKK